MFSKLIIKLINHQGKWHGAFVTPCLNINEAIAYEERHLHEYGNARVYIITVFLN